MLKAFEFSFARLISVLRLLAQETWNIRIKFFCSSSEMCNYSSVRGISLESGGVQSQIILKFFQYECAFINVVYRILGTNA